MKDLNLQPESKKLLEKKNIGETLQANIRHTFLDPRGTGSESMTRQMKIYKTKKLLHSKRNNQRRQLTGWRKVVADSSSDKGLISSRRK